MYTEQMREMLSRLGKDNWTVIDSCVLLCPHGHRVELDGRCPEGCVSPLRKAGMI